MITICIGFVLFNYIDPIQKTIINYLSNFKDSVRNKHDKTQRLYNESSIKPLWDASRKIWGENTINKWKECITEQETLLNKAHNIYINIPDYKEENSLSKPDGQQIHNSAQNGPGNISYKVKSLYSTSLFLFISYLYVLILTTYFYDCDFVFKEYLLHFDIYSAIYLILVFFACNSKDEFHYPPYRYASFHKVSLWISKYIICPITHSQSYYHTIIFSAICIILPFLWNPINIPNSMNDNDIIARINLLLPILFGLVYYFVVFIKTYHHFYQNLKPLKEAKRMICDAEHVFNSLSRAIGKRTKKKPNIGFTSPKTSAPSHR